MSGIRPINPMYATRIAMRTTPPMRLMTMALSIACPANVATPEGSMTNSNTLRHTASTAATPMTTLSMLAPSFSASHFSKRLGSSSSTPSIWVDFCSTPMPMASMDTMLTTPRTIGHPIHLCRLAGDSYGSRSTTMLPSGRRTATATASGDFIMTPSMTA